MSITQLFDKVRAALAQGESCVVEFDDLTIAKQICRGKLHAYQSTHHHVPALNQWHVSVMFMYGDAPISFSTDERSMSVAVTEIESRMNWWARGKEPVQP